MLDLKMTVNTMVAQLSTLAKEVTRVSLEVGTEDILGGQTVIADVQGMWIVCTMKLSLVTKLIVYDHRYFQVTST